MEAVRWLILGCIRVCERLLSKDKQDGGFTAMAGFGSGDFSYGLPGLSGGGGRWCCESGRQGISSKAGKAQNR